MPDMQLKLFVFHVDLFRLMELVSFMSLPPLSLSPHVREVLWLAPDRLTYRQPNVTRSSHV
jgi:hypothetical protein